MFVYKPNKFNFFALSIGSIIPDLECLLLFLFIGETWGARLIMHSLVGAVTIDLLIVVLAVIFIVPVILGFMDKKIENKNYFLFGNVDLRKHKSSAVIIITSGLIGTLSHVLLDVFHHDFNPLTYPFEQYYSFNLILFNDLYIANVLMNGITGLFFILMLYYWYLRNIE